MTTDAIVMRKDKYAGLQVLLIRRKDKPFKKHLAFPGGFCGYGENPKVSVLRELKEECGLNGWEPKLFAVKGDPHRDPRKHIITIFYNVLVSEAETIKAGDDAASAQWYNMYDIWSRRDFAFDHKKILFDYTEKYHPKYTKTDRLVKHGIRDLFFG